MYWPISRIPSSKPIFIPNMFFQMFLFVFQIHEYREKKNPQFSKYMLFFAPFKYTKYWFKHFQFKVLHYRHLTFWFYWGFELEHKQNKANYKISSIWNQYMPLMLECLKTPPKNEKSNISAILIKISDEYQLLKS